MGERRIERALISAWRKDGIADFGRWLAGRGVEILSTGGTARTLREAGVPVRDVAEVTGFPEMMDGRVKTLHPRIHGGLLFRRDDPEHRAAAEAHGIPAIDLVVVDLYPFEDAAADPGAGRDDCVEMIDIGGPGMIRAAAKNHADVVVVTDPADLATVREAVEAGGGTTTPALRRGLAAKAFRRTAAYDAAIAEWMGEEPFPERLVLAFERREVTRYGENPHQRGAVYVATPAAPGSVAAARQLAGKELSYNNFLDAAAAWDVVRDQPECAVAVVKHRNPCGAAVHADPIEAFRRAYAGDPLSAYGGILATNRTLDRALAEEIADPSRFLEVIVAPEFAPDAVEHLRSATRWGRKVRLLETGRAAGAPDAAPREVRTISGGLLVQDADRGPDEELRVVTRRAPTDEELRDLRLAFDLARHVTSNAITFVAEGALVGCGAGQMSRVDAVELAAKKAGARARGAAMGSDAFFPFADGILAAREAGITAVAQPGGSIRDDEVVAACDEVGLAMVFTGRRHFRH